MYRPDAATPHSSGALSCIFFFQALFIVMSINISSFGSEMLRLFFAIFSESTQVRLSFKMSGATAAGSKLIRWSDIVDKTIFRFTTVQHTARKVMGSYVAECND